MGRQKHAGGPFLGARRQVCAGRQNFYKKFSIFFKNPLHCQGVYCIMIKRLRMPLACSRGRYAMKREVATPLCGFFRRVCPIKNRATKILFAKGYDPTGVQFPRTLRVVCPGELRLAVHRLSSCKSVTHPARCSVFFVNRRTKNQGGDYNGSQGENQNSFEEL